VADAAPLATALLAGLDLPTWGWGLLALLLPELFCLVLVLLWPSAFFRLAVWILTRTLYRIRRSGLEYLPTRGGALLICNPLVVLDWLLLWSACPRRLRFVVYAGWVKEPLVRRALHWLGAWALDGSATAEQIERVLRAAGEAVAQGEVVCLFCQGRAGPAGQLPFAHQYALVTRHCPQAAVIPVCVDQAWGTTFRYRPGGYVWFWPQEVPYRVMVSFGAPLPVTTPVAEVVQTRQLLTVVAQKARLSTRLPVHRQFVRVAARHPFRTCVLDSLNPQAPLSYARTLAGSICLANALRPLLGDAPMIAVWLPPGTGGVLTNVALALLRKTSINLNYTTPGEGLRSALRQCGARFVLTARRFTDRMPLDPGEGVQLIYLEDVRQQITKGRQVRAFLSVVFFPGWFLDRWLLRLGRHHLDDLATVIFSSGSTGDPKGVMLTHGNIAANVESVVQATHFDRADRALGVLPFFHSFGYCVTLWVPLQVGASALYHADPRQAREIGELCRKYQCTLYASTATFLRFCLKKCEPGDFTSLRILMCGAEKLPPSLAEDFRKRFGILPLEGYGTTELAPVAGANIPDVTIGDVVEINNRMGTIGPPIPGVAFRVAHPDTHAILPLGQEGVVQVAGANVMRGYLGKPELTARVLRDGWYTTGDMGRLDEAGFLTLTGRLSRFAKIAGEMVPLEKIEEELHEALETSERVCAVTCIPDEARGERVVVLHLHQDGLEVGVWWRRLSGRGLPSLWLPSERDFYLVPELPLLGSGKVNLQALKELALSFARSGQKA
jgi:acyl-[acyl-carrier-protein]-phospholipid O-acyltransferase/long-chain-fatty-acid--[acyl-carrier-protein] ligase